jgi:hypothetical protein
MQLLKKFIDLEPRDHYHRKKKHFIMLCVRRNQFNLTFCSPCIVVIYKWICQPTTALIKFYTLQLPYICFGHKVTIIRGFVRTWTVVWNSVQKITPTRNLIYNGLREVKCTYVRTKPLMMVTL